MKKFISVLLVLAILSVPMSMCVAESAQPLRIITTIFPMYDWVREIAGAHAADMDLKMLLTTGIDLHNYQPTAEDIVAVSECDMFIYVGGESDAWVEDVLRTASNENMIAVNLLDVLGEAVRAEETVEGMQPEEHEYEEGEHEEGEEEEEELDEHVWLSLRNAQVICSELAAQLGNLDPANADEYATNAAAYNEKLAELDGRYQEAVDAAGSKTLLFGDRFPFRYMVDDYGLDYYAAFSGCAAASEASFETIVFLASKVDELNLPTVLTLEGSDHEIAETVVANSTAKSAKIVEMNSMQSINEDDLAAGVSYLSLMEQNLGSLIEALN